MDLKVPFVRLTLHEPSEGSSPYVWINMARCQEMYGHTDHEPWTELILNIALGHDPYSIAVVETPEEIIRMIQGSQEKHLNG